MNLFMVNLHKVPFQLKFPENLSPLRSPRREPQSDNNLRKTMTIVEQDIPVNVKQILDVHHALWNATSDPDGEHKLEYKDSYYNIYIPSHQGYASVVLPSGIGKNFLWITQNLNKSSYASIEIKKARSQGDDKRVTWIVDNSNDKFYYCALIKTCSYFDGKQDILIEKYSENGTQLVYSTDPFYVNYLPPKSRY